MTTLNVSDFSVEKGENGNNLRISVTGPSAILVGQSSDDETLRARSVFNKLAIAGLTKAYIDISSNNNRKIIALSKTTVTPITALPTLFFCVDGKIRAIYKKDTNINSMMQWFQEKMGKFSQTRMPMSMDRVRQKADTFSISRGEQEQQESNASVGINAAWRLEK